MLGRGWAALATSHIPGQKCAGIVHGDAWGPAAPAIRQAHYLDAFSMLEGPGDDASVAGRVWQALHGEGLPAACLAVGR